MTFSPRDDPGARARAGVISLGTRGGELRRNDFRAATLMRRLSLKDTAPRHDQDTTPRHGLSAPGAGAVFFWAKDRTDDVDAVAKEKVIALEIERRDPENLDPNRHVAAIDNNGQQIGKISIRIKPVAGLFRRLQIARQPAHGVRLHRICCDRQHDDVIALVAFEIP